MVVKDDVLEQGFRVTSNENATRTQIAHQLASGKPTDAHFESLDPRSVWHKSPGGGYLLEAGAHSTAGKIIARNEAQLLAELFRTVEVQSIVTVI